MHMARGTDIHLEGRLAELEAAVAALAADNAVLASDLAEALAANESLKAEVGSLEARNADLRAAYDRMVENWRLAAAARFGTSSEKLDPAQLPLFDACEALADLSQPEPPLRDCGVRKPRRRGGRRTVDTSALRREVVDVWPESDECPVCGAKMAELAVDVTEVVHMRPAELWVEERRVHTYVCPECSKRSQDEGTAPTIVRARARRLPIPGSFASADLLAGVVWAKYGLAQPLARVESDFASHGIRLLRQTMSNWMISIHRDWLGPLARRLEAELLSQGIVQADETSVLVLGEPGRENRAKSYMWLFRSAGCAERRACVFRYAPTRSGEVPRAFLEGWEGWLVTDGYDPYYSVGGATNVSCLAHIRRRFAQALELAKGGSGPQAGIAAEGLARIAAIYRAESELRKGEPGRWRDLRADAIRPLVEDFPEWAGAALPLAQPGLKLHEALSYALEYWPHFANVLEDGRLPLDNNLAERTIRPFTVGRKNWGFCGCPAGAEASAAIYSLLRTCQENGVDARGWFAWALDGLPNAGALTDDVLDSFLPWSPEVPAGLRLDERGVRVQGDVLDEPVAEVDPETAKLIDRAG